MKTIIIGDIHGCKTEFLALLQKCKLDTKNDMLILLGDVIDRGPDSYGVVREILRLRAEMDGKLVQIMGNHEDMAIAAYDFGDRSLWYNNGRNRTRKSFYASGGRVQNYLPYLRELPLYYETERFICVHAGISRKGLVNTRQDVFLWNRSVAEEGWYNGKLLVYGHTPMKSVVYSRGDGKYTALPVGKKMQLPETGSICLDTGCVFGNKLSVLVIENGTFSVKAVPYAG